VHYFTVSFLVNVRLSLFLLRSLFIYKLLDALSNNPRDLVLEWKLPIDASFVFNIGTSFLSMLASVFSLNTGTI